MAGARVALIMAALVAASGIKWHPSWQTAMKAAAKSGKLVYIFVYLPRRAPCAQMDERTFRDPEVIKLMRKFEAAAVDASTIEGGRFVERYHLPLMRDPQRGLKIAIVPNHLFFTPKGRELHRQVGYLPPIAFRALLQRVLKLNELIQAVHRSPKDPRLQAELGHLYLELNREREGRRHLELAIALDPDNSAGAKQRGILDLAILSIKEDPKLAIGRLRRWLEQYGRGEMRVEAEFYLASAYIAAGHRAKAEDILIKYVKAKKGTIEAESYWGARARALYDTLHGKKPIKNVSSKPRD